MVTLSAKGFRRRPSHVGQGSSVRKDAAFARSEALLVVAYVCSTQLRGDMYVP